MSELFRTVSNANDVSFWLHYFAERVRTVIHDETLDWATQQG